MLLYHKRIPIFFPTINFFIIFLLFIVSFWPKSVLSKNIDISTWYNFNTNKSYLNHKNQNFYLDNSLGLRLEKYDNKSIQNITLNFTKNGQLSFDQSHLKYKINNTTIGIGKIHRNWSFSPITSLILSNNARPSDSVFINMKAEKKSNNPFFSWIGPWSVEGFNSILSGNNIPKNTMLLGMRILFEPVNNLKFELVKTSQWGGKGYPKNLSSLSSAIIGNTNENENSNINQLAGFGFSYKFNKDNLPYRIYGQFIGEDEAGNLPSCYMHLLGTELISSKTKYATKVGFEYVDTRIDRTTHGFCGPNTAYNNGIYAYTNYGISMGAPIDTEGKSLNLWGETRIIDNLKINYSLKNLVINDSNWSNHRLSSSRKHGWQTDFGISWKKEFISFNSNITYQNFKTEKNHRTKGLIFNITTIYDF
jgi:hypothetical protein